MKFTMHVQCKVDVEAKDEGDALKQLAAITVGETERLSTQILPAPPEHSH